MAMPSMCVSVCVGVIQAKCVRRKSGEAINAADQQRGQHPWRAQKTNDRRPEKVVLLFDCQRPCWADGGRQREMEEVLQKQKICPPGCGPDRVPDRRADEPWSVEVADDQHQYIDRPDAKRTACVEIAEVVWFVT